MGIAAQAGQQVSRQERLASATPASSDVRSRRGAQRAIAIALIAAAAILSLGIAAPLEKDQETQSAQWIQAIVYRGEWLLPRDYYGGIDRKPPLYYWLSALTVKITGGRVDAVTARLVSLFAGVLIAVVVMRWAAAFAGESTGWLALAFVLGTYGFASRAALDLTDMLFSLLVFTVWWCVYRMLEERGSPAVPIGGGILLGLAILTKGPLAIVLIGLAGLIYLLLARRSPLDVLGRGWPWLMLALGLAIGACWYVPAFVEGGRLVVGVFLSENFGHFMPAAMGGTGEASRPFWYIAARMIGGALPQSLLIVAASIAIYRRDGEPRARKPMLFQLSLVAAVLVFFSIASSKRDDYILPAMPGLAILFAALFTEAGITAARGDSLSARVRDLTAAIIAAGSFGLVVLGLVIAHEPRLLGGFYATLQSSDASLMRLFVSGMRHLTPPFAIFTVVTIGGAAAAFFGLAAKRTIWTGAGIALIALAGSTLFSGTLKPELSRARTLQDFTAQIKGRIGDAPLYIPWGHEYELSYYYGRGIPALDDASPSLLKSAFPVYVFARPRDLKLLTPAIRGRLTLVMESGLIGGGGPPALYELPPDTADVLKSTAGAAR
jgi:4-amino-4-deoxy-L-arabinose transferase-like glycosyltransferase